jgi:hypothetical protein|tara:strand:- start:552 stop:803 length:252 start_codon:yes stop_codon:yes gene_type:complete
MNEQIKLLAEQADVVQYGIDYNRDSYPTNLEALENFAQLIVQQCLSIAQQEHKHALEFEWDNDDTAQAIRDSISEYFKVVEEE